LTGATFKSALEGKGSLVMFYAPWCGHCKAMKPAFDEVGGLFNGQDSPVVIGKVDCTVETDLCSKYGVSGYPTLQYFDAASGLDAGKPYSGGRDVPGLKSFVEETLKPKCSAKNPEGCSEKEKGFLAKVQSLAKSELEEQIARLDKMKGSSMAPELKQWLHQRLAILKELFAVA